ncbi:hypothetical protein HU200_025804 [Digitaria exilis]|uniref:Uncharacterized protein n=1 Tax=Digitaria exilis TaxID=1010633 RepID=A0A835EUZ9_9POAL|nr:hypothetical protein HU200_025804 [Digitaria exilis]
MARAAVFAVLLVQCCNLVLAARPLLDAGGRYSGMIMQVLDKGCSVPGEGNNSGWQGPHPPPGC